VDLQAFAPAPGDGAWLDRLADLKAAPRGVVRIGLVATYARWKGHGCFLQALGRLRQVNAVAPFRGYVVGGPLYQTPGSQVTRVELEEFAQRAGVADRVGFVPFQHDPAGVYRALDVVVHASTQPEPFGLTIAEGMACGRAVVVSAAGGAAELFTDDHDAVGVPPDDPAALAAALARLAGDADLRQRLGASARHTAVARFGQDRFARQVVDFYERLLGGHPAPASAPAAARLLDTRV
jgi:glycosyltransferase involved in cell wall biosynthesis